MHVTLGKTNLASQESEGLGDTFVLTNPRLPDHPIVLVSDGFVDVTGYPKAQVIGRNCRTYTIVPCARFISCAWLTRFLLGVQDFCRVLERHPPAFSASVMD
jgi:hypothetical protein